MLEYIYVCRHGFRSNWVDPSIKTGPTGMNRDPPVSCGA
jgi:transcription factor C subunit 7